MGGEEPTRRAKVTDIHILETRCVRHGMVIRNGDENNHHDNQVLLFGTIVPIVMNMDRMKEVEKTTVPIPMNIVNHFEYEAVAFPMLKTL